jgi:hypothetical protein
MIRNVGLRSFLAAGSARGQATPRPPSPSEGRDAVQKLSWFAGCWRRQAPGGASVVEEIEGTMRGQARGVDFAYARVPCP